MNSAIILTTIHAADFRDVEGDRASGRLTLPLAYPAGSRAVMCVLLPGWSLAISYFCGLGAFLSLLFVLLGVWVGCKFSLNLSQDLAQDQAAYDMYNVSRLLTLQFAPWALMFSRYGCAAHTYCPSLPLDRRSLQSQSAQ